MGRVSTSVSPEGFKDTEIGLFVDVKEYRLVSTYWDWASSVRPEEGETSM